MSADSADHQRGSTNDRRLGRAATVLGALIAFAALIGAANAFYLGAAVWRDIATEQYVGQPTVLDYAFLAVPLAIQVALFAVVITVGLRLRRHLRAGDEHARRSVFRLSFWCVAGLAIAVYATGTVLESSNPGDGAPVRPALLWETMTSGGLNALGWLGVATAAALLALVAGAVAMAVMTRPTARGTIGAERPLSPAT
jgi:hypothetical protein